MTRMSPTPTAVTALFDRSKKRRNTQQQKLHQEIEQEIKFEKSEAVKVESFHFLNTFIETSAWKERSHQISIAWDNLPSLEELESYGCLGENEGTKACRRLFNAPVIWDALGHGLWENLSKNQSRRSTMTDSTLETDSRRASVSASPRSTPRSSRRSSKTSVKSRLSSLSRRSSAEKQTPRAYRRRSSSTATSSALGTKMFGVQVLGRA